MTLVQCIQYLHSQGWAPATSSNYSVRQHDHILISKSGVDKQLFAAEHLMKIDPQGSPIEDQSLRPSAETAIHTMLYALYPDINCVLHTHTVNNTVLSKRYPALVFEGLEILKGLDGVGTHEHREVISVFQNSQDIPALAAEIKQYLQSNTGTHAFLLKGHGMYTWGSTVAETKRQVEVLEFLFEYRIKMDLYGNATDS